MANTAISGSITTTPGAGTISSISQFASTIAPPYAGATPPSSPATGALWWETDTSIMWFWNGTYWLSTQLFKLDSIGTMYNSGISATTGVGGITAELDQAIRHNLFVVDLCASMYFTAADTGVNYWNITLRRNSSAAAATSMSTVSGQNNTTATYVTEKLQVDTYIDLSTIDVQQLELLATKVNNPGTLYATASVTFRWAHT